MLFKKKENEPERRIMKNFKSKYFGKLPATVFAFGSIVWFSIFASCASYGAGGMYTSGNQNEMGVYVFGNSQFTETTVSYSANLAEKNTQLFGLGLLLKFPIPIWKVTIFPLAGIEYQVWTK